MICRYSDKCENLNLYDPESYTCNEAPEDERADYCGIYRGSLNQPPEHGKEKGLCSRILNFFERILLKS